VLDNADLAKLLTFIERLNDAAVDTGFYIDCTVAIVDFTGEKVATLDHDADGSGYGVVLAT
jgi:hypothetical protein